MFLKKLKNIGPGAMVAAAFIGPGTVTTATIAGASCGYTLLWAVLFSTCSTVILQEMAGRLGVVGRVGVGQAVLIKARQPYLKKASITLILVAIFVGNAAYEAGNITGAVIGFDHLFDNGFNPLILLLGAVAFLLLYTGRYKLIEKTLVALVGIMGVVFLIAALAVRPDWSACVQGLFSFSVPDNALLVVMGLIGTTVVPYNLFLHASVAKRKWQDANQLAEVRWDTIISVLFGGLITMCILICAAVAFQGQEGDISSAADLALQLKPVLGNWAENFIAFGFLAAGLSSSITAPLAASFATTEILGWSEDMGDTKFRWVWFSVLLIGIILSSMGWKPTALILIAQAANGILLPIIAGFLLWTMNDKSILKNYTNGRLSNILGFIVCSVTLALALKSLMTVLGTIF